ncbi:MAG: GNAT family N-acetyltransferase [Firmicutes bacterium]|nr:GNAT family N-acetyltransferase [Bacillota bacterium]
MKRIETERLILDKWSKKDAKDLFEFAMTPNVCPSAGWKHHESVDESKTLIKNLFIPNRTWKITMKGEDQAIGSIGFEPDPRRPEIRAKELGYSLSEDYWGLGIMTEAAREVVRYAFEEEELQVLSIEAAPDNKRSLRVIEKLGFKFEGRLRDAYRTFDGKIRDTMVFSITKDDWMDMSK